MIEKEFVLRIRLNIFHHTDEKKKTIIYLCRKYGVSRNWFYKWKKRRDKYGDEGLKTQSKSKTKDAKLYWQKDRRRDFKILFEARTY